LTVLPGSTIMRAEVTRMTKRIILCYVLIVLSALFAVLHNILSAAQNGEDVLFFVLTLVFTVGFVASVLYCTVSYIKKGEPKDLWKLGWIGLLGLLGLVPQLTYGLFGFFGFFGFFGARGWRDSPSG
jgi:hypothetical protein